MTYVIVPEIGRWRGMTYTPAQTDQPYPAMSLILDVDADKNTSGVLTIYPVDVPENALELVTKNGCKVNFESVFVKIKLTS